MLRSGCVMSSSRARFPTTISPDSLTETTLGTSLSPSAPGMILGPVRSMKATRLLVVPRSMPTTRSLVPKSIWNIETLGRWEKCRLHLHQKILDVFSAVQQGTDGHQGFPLQLRIVGGKKPAEVVIDLVHH